MRSYDSHTSQPAIPSPPPKSIPPSSKRLAAPPKATHSPRSATISRNCASASKPRDFNLKREQNPRYRQHNGLTLLWLGQPGGGFFHGFCDQQRLFLAES